MQYPVLDILGSLKEKLAKHPIVILQAPPGAGKSTVLPLHLLDCHWLGDQKVIMLEPRRLAARSVAMRLAHLHGDEPGQTIGYRVRFETKVSAATRVEVLTEGILTRMIQQDSALEGTGLIIFDEFHERSLHADLALALTLQIQNVLRPDLRVLIMSATLDTAHIAALLNAPVVTSEGRQYPVSISYVAPDAGEKTAISTVKAIRRAFHSHTGDILAFLPGAGEIQRAAGLLDVDPLPAEVHALYGDLNFSKQQAAILPARNGARKIVLATSIAETSLTIEGITVVVDSGLARVPRFDPRSGLTRLETVPVTRDAADQRAGRAGRLSAGTCYRLWKEAQHQYLLPNRKPEILEADLATLMLEVAQWGVDLHELSWVTPPPPGAVAQAKDLLTQLDALSNGKITDRGRAMLRLPAHPRIAHMLLVAKEEHGPVGLALACDLAALLEEKDPLGREAGADLSLRVLALRRWRSGERVSADTNRLDRIERVARSWRSVMQAAHHDATVNDDLIGALLMQAYPERVARQMEKHGDRYKLFNGRMVRLPQHDALSREEWLVVAELDAGQGEGKIFMAAPLNIRDLEAHARQHDRVEWDDQREMVVGYREMRFGPLVLSSKPVHSIQEEQRMRVIVELVREKGLKVLGWSEALERWQARVESLRQWRPEEPWPHANDDALIQTVEDWLAPFLTGVYKRSDLERLSAAEILSTILPYDLQARIDKIAPERLTVPSGSSIRLQYHASGAPPVMEVRLQEVFGMLETPTVNEGRTRIILHLLSPGFKPVQVTQDLRSFWSGTYAEVRKELRSRYPKHSWPEDPWTAQAVRGVPRRN